MTTLCRWISAMMVSLIAATVALTVLPAVLALLGTRVNALAPKRLQLDRARRAGLVEKAGVDLDLADIVHQRRPAQLVPVLTFDPELCRNEVCQQVDAVGMAASPGVVVVERGDQCEDPLRGAHRIVFESAAAGLLRARLQVAQTGRLACHPQP
jgi:hypothetical protein